MGTRLELQHVLEELIGNRNVYFQPPETIKLKYPCIIYERNADDERLADNLSYFRKRRYSLMYIDTDPDNDIADKINDLPYCSMSGNPFTRDNLYHYNFSIYF